MIETLLKTIQCEYGELYSIIGNRRILLAKCNPTIDIYEQKTQIKAIGGCGVKRWRVAVAFCSDCDFTREVDEQYLSTVTRFELSVNVQRSDGVFENIFLNNIAPIEIFLNDDWQFEITDMDIIKKLMAI